MRRRSTRKQKGRGCGCGGMEMLGFPKSGGFTSLFGGQESTTSIGENSQMKKESLPDEMYQPQMKKQSYTMPQKPTMPINPEEEGVSQAMGFSGPLGRQSIRKSQIPSAIDRELRRMKQDIQTLKDQVSDLQNNNPSGYSSPGLFGGRRKTLRRMRKHRR
jgi:hypothetical protein